MTEIFRRLKKLIIENYATACEEDTITPNTHLLHDIGISDTDYPRFTNELSEEFGIPVSSVMLEKTVLLGELTLKIKSLVEKCSNTKVSNEK